VVASIAIATSGAVASEMRTSLLEVLRIAFLPIALALLAVYGVLEPPNRASLPPRLL
jgi:hypothetical protein